MTRHRVVPLLLAFGVALGGAAACTPAPGTAGTGTRQQSDTSYMRSVFGPTWTLVAINGASPPAGSGGRPATLQFYSGSERRATGYSGCNGWSSTWKRGGGDSLSFAAPVSTRMACDQGMDLETRFLRIIEQTRRFSQRDSTLTLRTTTGDSARLVAR